MSDNEDRPGYYVDELQEHIAKLEAENVRLCEILRVHRSLDIVNDAFRKEVMDAYLDECLTYDMRNALFYMRETVEARKALKESGE